MKTIKIYKINNRENFIACQLWLFSKGICWASGDKTVQNLFMVKNCKYFLIVRNNEDFIFNSSISSFSEDEYDIEVFDVRERKLKEILKD